MYKFTRMDRRALRRLVLGKYARGTIEVGFRDGPDGERTADMSQWKPDDDEVCVVSTKDLVGQVFNDTARFDIYIRLPDHKGQPKAEWMLDHNKAVSLKEVIDARQAVKKKRS